MSEKIKRTSKALLGVYRKGMQAYRDGKPRECPYTEKRTDYHNGVTFSCAIIKFWYEGYDDASLDLPEQYTAHKIDIYSTSGM